MEAIDITAALARCAMSRTEAPGVFAAGLASAGAVGALSATWVDAAGAATSFFGTSASLGASTFFGASASFGVSTGFAAGTAFVVGDASAILTASTGLGASLCGAEAANLSLNIIEAGTVSGAEIFGAGAGSEANTSLKVGRAGRAATTLDCLIDRRLDRRAVHRRIDARRRTRWCRPSRRSPAQGQRRQRRRGNVEE